MSTGQWFILKHNEIEQKYEQNQVEQNKQNPFLCLYIYIIYVWPCIKEQTYKYLAYTSQMQQEIASFKQYARIFV